MGYTVDVDIGGTLTDGLFAGAERAEAVKVDTTPHDFTVCFFDCLREGARRFGHSDLGGFLQEVAVIRWSSTIATNVVAERKGPRVGLLVSSDQERRLYGQEPSPAIGFLVQPDHLVGIRQPVQRDEVLTAVRHLLEKGVRRVCVSLGGAFADPGPERQVKAWIEEQFPDHYLGSVPVLLGSDMLAHPDDRTRTHLALINAYVHTPLAVSLFKAEDEILDQRYRRPVLIGHINGGVARIAKTKGVDTTESGPVLGLAASAWFAGVYGLDRVLSVDIGGTTAKLGVVVEGRPALAERGDLFGVPLAIPWIALRSIGVGGGSVLSVSGGEVQVGPESMGAYPGPAAYGLGSRRATVTDALVVAGRLNPERFLGGRRRLQVERAREALQVDLAEPLGVGLEAAAERALSRVTARVAEAASSWGGQGGAAASLFAFGGNGANFAAALAEALGADSARVFSLGPVFSAFGSSAAQVRHLEEAWPVADLGDEAARSRLAELLQAMRGRLLRDVAGEGFPADRAELSAELLVDGRRVPLPPGADGSYGSALAALAGAARGSEVVRAGAQRIERLAVTAVCPVPAYQPPRREGPAYQPSAQGEREVLFAGPAASARIYDWDGLRAGARIEGPAMLEAAANTCAVPEGWALEVDGYGNGLLTARR